VRTQSEPSRSTSRDAPDRFWSDTLGEADPEVLAAIRGELKRQQDKIELIASENIASRAVLEAAGSVFTNKYAEGYPGKRYYGGCEYADEVETLAIERAKKLFGCAYANVQPNSGSQMNQAVFLALLQPGDIFMGLDLNSGGHLTHGSPVNMSGKWFSPVSYGVRREDELIDMDEVMAIARANRPKLIIAGGTAYSRIWDWAAFRRVADEVGATLMADISHISGLVAGGAHPSPFPHAHIVTTTTHKSLRGPRSGVILWNDEALVKPLNMAVFPGLQGGPLMHIIAAKAVAFTEALRPEFRDYAHRVVDNARALAASLEEQGLRVVSGGTDNHLMLVDLSAKNVTGKDAEKGLDRAWLTTNKNGIPYDSRSPFVTSGIRLGTPAGTTRGFGTAEFRTIGKLIAEVVEGLAKNGAEGDGQVEESVRGRVTELCQRFPVYPGM
jgi:glycine hydroxymethyltransferase